MELLQKVNDLQLLDLFFLFCFCFEDTTALFKSVLGPFLLLLLLFFCCFLGCNGPIPKSVHGATPESP